MSHTRTPDVVLADHFTKTQHRKASPSIDPSLPTNKLRPQLNVCIIGASRGIGASIAYAYAQAGACTLILAARPSSSAQLADVQRRCNDINPHVKTVALDVDITSAPSVAQFVHNIQTHIPTLDILILNSGYSGPVVLRLTSGLPSDFQDVFDVNVQGTYLVAHFLLPLLLASKEGARTFLVVGSLAACITSGHIANTAYCVSKFAQARLVEFIAMQYKDEGVLCVAMHPGAVLTEMADSTTPESFRKYLTDDPGLCGAFCVWLSREKEDRMWMNGRMVSATWDVDELVEKREKIEGQDLLKWGYRVGDAHDE